MAMAETRSGKVALVTGGGRGLGKAIALSLADMGIGIVLTWHSNGEAADGVVGQIRASGGKAAALQLDVAVTTSFDDFFDRLREVLQREFGATSIDFLINNAGFGQTIPIAELTEADFDRFVNVHFKGVVFLTQKALAMMNDDGCRRVRHRRRRPLPRAGLCGLCRLQGCGGGVLALCRQGIRLTRDPGQHRGPGGIVTDFNNAAIRSNPQVQQFLVAQTPMGRLGEARDIGGIVALLCGDEARWLTGQRLEATGGFNL